MLSYLHFFGYPRCWIDRIGVSLIYFVFCIKMEYSHVPFFFPSNFETKNWEGVVGQIVFCSSVWASSFMFDEDEFWSRLLGLIAVLGILCINNHTIFSLELVIQGSHYHTLIILQIPTYTLDMLNLLSFCLQLLVIFQASVSLGTML